MILQEVEIIFTETPYPKAVWPDLPTLSEALNGWAYKVSTQDTLS